MDFAWGSQFLRWSTCHNFRVTSLGQEYGYPSVYEQLWNIWIKYKFLTATKHIRMWNISIQYIPRNMHTVFALLCFVVVIHWLIFPYPPGLLHWHCGNLTIAPVPAKQPWWIWINTSCEFIMNDCITTTKQSTTKLCAYFLGYTVFCRRCSASFYWTVNMLCFECSWLGAHLQGWPVAPQCHAQMTYGHLEISKINVLACITEKTDVKTGLVTMNWR